MDGHGPSRNSGIMPLASANTALLNPSRANQKHNAAESILEHGFPYSRRLRSHTTCVNALVFSSGDGRWLASGGDDLKVKLWDLHQDDITEPSANLLGARGNIFSIAFSANNRYLYSGGVCETVFRHDLSTLGQSTISSTPQTRYTDIEGHVRSISCHPYNEDLAMSSSEDGIIARYDARVSNHRRRPGDTLQIGAEATGSLYHPNMEHIFLTSDSRGRVTLRDERMAFGHPARTGGGIVLKYNTRLTRRNASLSHIVRAEASSITWDRDGSRFGVTMQCFLPTIYTTQDPNPIATCSGKLEPVGEPDAPSQKTYSNSCTMKHGSFGGPGMDSDNYFGAGSDDFRGYIWKLPPTDFLIDQRQEISHEDWLGPEIAPQTVAFTGDAYEPKIVPVELSRPHCRLKGHRSIVNTVLFHPRLFHVVTAGIERDIILHSPTAGSPCARDLERTDINIRRMSADGTEDRRNYLMSIIDDDELRDEERTISMFDYLVREEGNRDVFASRRRSRAADSSDEDDESDMDISNADSEDGEDGGTYTDSSGESDDHGADLF